MALFNVIIDTFDIGLYVVTLQSLRHYNAPLSRYYTQRWIILTLEMN